MDFRALSKITGGNNFLWGCECLLPEVILLNETRAFLILQNHV